MERLHVAIGNHGNLDHDLAEGRLQRDLRVLVQLEVTGGTVELEVHPLERRQVLARRRVGISLLLPALVLAPCFLAREAPLTARANGSSSHDFS